MKRAAYGILPVALLLAGSLWAGDQDFSLHNKTGYTISEVYVSPSRADEWGSDLLGKRNLSDDVTLNIHFPHSTSACKFDLKVVYDDDESAEWQNFDLCTISKITIHWNKKTQETTAEYE